jgi:predicted ATPase/DNA-binding SARP family transcriptional activator
MSQCGVGLRGAIGSVGFGRVVRAVVASVRILGPVQVWAGGRRLAVGGPRQLALLAFLVLHANRAVSADAIIDALWGASRPGSASPLQMAIARLRKALEPLQTGADQWLQTVSGGYLLAIEAGDLDADVFACGVRDGRDALDTGDPARAREMLTEALALWRGPPLAEVGFEDFAQPEIRRLEELRSVALEARVDAGLQLGHHAGLVGELQGLLAEQPARERVASQLMLALYRSGRQADALDVYQRTRAHLTQELGLEPGPALKSLQSQILEHAPSLQPNASRHRWAHQPVGSEPERTDREITGPTLAALPVVPTPTIGREAEVEAVGRVLGGPDARLVTLTGPGGVGKTRLALVVARTIESSFPDGVCWVELAGLALAADVASTVARAVAVTAVAGESTRDALRRYLATKRLLLVLDNFEHVLDAATLLAELLGACPGLTVLVTSREALNLAAEHRVVVSPLALPPVRGHLTLDEIESSAAGALFLAAARRRDSRFAVASNGAPAVAQICKRLDGLPLALELAARCTGLLSLRELAASLQVALSEVSLRGRDTPTRQQTLHAAIEWSYRLLHGDEASAFARFGVFAAGATLEAAQAVTGATLDTLDALVAKSLLDRRQQPDGMTRLMMLETIRQYAQQSLGRDPQHDTVRRRHLDYYLQLVQDLVSRFATRDELQAMAMLDHENENVIVALHWGVAHAPGQALKLAGQLGEYWQTRGDPGGLRWLDSALDRAGDAALLEDRARAHLFRSAQLSMHQEHAMARDAAQQALALYKESGDHAGISRAHRRLAQPVSLLGDKELSRASAEAAYDHARLAGDDALMGGALAQLASWGLPSGERRVMLERAAVLLTRAGDDRELAIAYNNAAYEDLIEGRIDEAMGLLEIAVPAALSTQRPHDMMLSFGNLGLAHLFSGDLAQARKAFEDQLRLCLGHSFRYGADEGLAGIAAVCAGEGRPRHAARLLGAARALGYPPAYDQPIYDRLESDFFAPARTPFGAAEWARSEEDGAALSYDQAIASALR